MVLMLMGGFRGCRRAEPLVLSKTPLEAKGEEEKEEEKGEKKKRKGKGVTLP
jgi:hypothetical protein